MRMDLQRALTALCRGSFLEGTEREQEQFLTGLRGLFGVISQLKRCEVKRCVGKDNYDAGAPSPRGTSTSRYGGSFRVVHLDGLLEDIHGALDLLRFETPDCVGFSGSFPSSSAAR